jgi:hypothetical protein
VTDRAPRRQPAPRPLAVVLVVNVRGLTAWILEPADLEERKRRGEAVKKAFAAALELHHEDVNRQFRAEARLAAWTPRPPSTATTGAN